MPKLDIENLFKHHPPSEDQLRRYRLIRIAAKDFAKVVAENTRESAEQTLAIRKIQEAMMQANAAIACNEAELPYQEHERQHRQNPAKEHYPIG